MDDIWPQEKGKFFDDLLLKYSFKQEEKWSLTSEFSLKVLMIKLSLKYQMFEIE